MKYGKLALQCGHQLELRVCQSAAGYYIGTLDQHGAPFSRESQQYYVNHADAQLALETNTFTQKEL
jgi:hypothetical protein